MYALIPMFFIGRQRQIANSIAAMASVGGGALAFTIAGQIVAFAGSAAAGLPPPLNGLAQWRLSMIAAATLAPVMILLVLSIRVPPKSRAPRPPSAIDIGTTAAREYLWRHRGAYLRFYFGGAMGSFAFAALSIWLAVAAARTFGQGPAELGAAFGLAQICSAGCGLLLSVAVTRRWGERLGARLPVRMMWCGMGLAACTLLPLPWATEATHIYAVYAGAGIFLTFAAMAFPTALQTISPPDLRGRLASIQFIASMLVASAAAPVVGAVSDRLGGTNGVLLAVTLVAVPALAVGALLLRSCEGRSLSELLAESEASDRGAPAALVPA